jgi:hypothetical protein
MVFLATGGADPGRESPSGWNCADGRVTVDVGPVLFQRGYVFGILRGPAALGYEQRHKDQGNPNNPQTNPATNLDGNSEPEPGPARHNQLENSKAKLNRPTAVTEDLWLCLQFLGRPRQRVPDVAV